MLAAKEESRLVGASRSTSPTFVADSGNKSGPCLRERIHTNITLRLAGYAGGGFSAVVAELDRVQIGGEVLNSGEFSYCPESLSQSTTGQSRVIHLRPTHLTIAD